MLWDSCINMSWPFKLSPHITNLNLNEPPLQIHQQAMTLPTPPPQLRSPNPLLYSTTPSDTYTTAGNNFTPSLEAPPHHHHYNLRSTHTHALVPPFLLQPHQLHSAHLIKRGGQGEGEMVGDQFITMTFQDGYHPI
ncbi:hypothetical protein XENORESO_014364 [Xenotaenia resolanae]|uniref:Uncharacterized protein n=1 Tax=Xenotaenia resolanae TaxID=208358 RepID=A0ABV0WAR1_9TELE